MSFGLWTFLTWERVLREHNVNHKFRIELGTQSDMPTANEGSHEVKKVWHAKYDFYLVVSIMVICAMINP